MADWCAHKLRKVDVFGRYGGEEFVVLLPETTAHDTLIVVERLRQIGDTPLVIDETTITVTISLGISLLSDTISDLNKLLQSTDQALYEAKNAGRNRACIGGAQQAQRHPPETRAAV